MLKTEIPDKLKLKTGLLLNKLEEAFRGDLVSVALYGSAASGEFVANRSNLNLLVILKDLGAGALKKGAQVMAKFPDFLPLFLTEGYINSSSDVFPIEFLDMKENYTLIYGRDMLKDLKVELLNLRFQCEQEIKIKLISLRQLYFKSAGDKRLLLYALLKSFTSSLHILRNVLRLKGTAPPYKKELIITELGKLIPIDLLLWGRILAVKNKRERLNKAGIDRLFLNFIEELQKAAGFVDKL